MLFETSLSESVPPAPDPQRPPFAPYDPSDPGPQDESRRESVVLAIGLRSRVLRMCSRHTRIYCDAGADLSAAFSLALAEIRARPAVARLFDGDEHALFERLSAKLGAACTSCPDCEPEYRPV
jgi:hypothetical protein